MLEDVEGVPAADGEHRRTRYARPVITARRTAREPPHVDREQLADEAVFDEGLERAELGRVPALEADTGHDAPGIGQVRHLLGFGDIEAQRPLAEYVLAGIKCGHHRSVVARHLYDH